MSNDPSGPAPKRQASARSDVWLTPCRLSGRGLAWQSSDMEGGLPGSILQTLRPGLPVCTLAPQPVLPVCTLAPQSVLPVCMLAPQPVLPACMLAPWRGLAGCSSMGSCCRTSHGFWRLEPATSSSVRRKQTASKRSCACVGMTLGALLSKSALGSLFEHPHTTAPGLHQAGSTSAVMRYTPVPAGCGQ